MDPIWTVKTGSLFLWTVESRALFINEGLNLLVKDYDQFGHNEVLGMVNVPPAKLYKAEGERMEFKLKPAPGTKGKVNGYLAVRCRRASDYDINFMNKLEKSKDLASHHVEQKTQTGGGALRSIVTRNEKTEKDGTKKVSISVGAVG